MNYKIVALMGKAGSGKDSVLHSLIKLAPELHEIISCTTRPPREGEVDGINYHFLTHDDFAEQLNNGQMLEVAIFRGWCYGTSFANLDETKINIGVFNPTGVENLMEFDNIDILPIYLLAKDKTRVMRQLMRENDPDVKEIIRRFSTDEEDFNDITIQGNIAYKKFFEDQPIYVVENESQNIDDVAKTIQNLVSSWTKKDKVL